jgi:hypothetical protein
VSFGAGEAERLRVRMMLYFIHVPKSAVLFLIFGDVIAARPILVVALF